MKRLFNFLFITSLVTLGTISLQAQDTFTVRIRNVSKYDITLIEAKVGKEYEKYNLVIPGKARSKTKFLEYKHLYYKYEYKCYYKKSKVQLKEIQRFHIDDGGNVLIIICTENCNKKKEFFYDQEIRNLKPGGSVTRDGLYIQRKQPIITRPIVQPIAGTEQKIVK